MNHSRTHQLALVLAVVGLGACDHESLPTAETDVGYRAADSMADSEGHGETDGDDKDEEFEHSGTTGGEVMEDPPPGAICHYTVDRIEGLAGGCDECPLRVGDQVTGDGCMSESACSADNVL